LKSRPNAIDPSGGFAALRFRDFTLFLTAKFFTSVAGQLIVVAVGWQVYRLTGDVLDLGLIGLSQFLPFVALALFAGQAADRFDRRGIVLACNMVQLACAALLLTFAMFPVQRTAPIFAALALLGIARAFHSPAAQAILPNLVPPHAFGNAVALNSSTWHISTIAGPALGGALYALAAGGIGADSGASVVYGVAAALFVVATVLLGFVGSAPRRESVEPIDWHTLLQGLRFVWQRKPVLGAISLDLFAVLFGGATALLPAFTQDILHAGPDVFGYLRTAPGIGASMTAVALAFVPITRRVGAWMFGGVAVFGIATIVFGLTRNFWVAFAALAVLGSGDMVSVFIRHILVQLETPDEIRGRVSAVNSLFIGTSNELGEFESGLTASWFGLVPAIVLGGAATLGVTYLWAGHWFPMLWRMQNFAELKGQGWKK
jgi:MFS family permease